MNYILENDKLKLEISSFGAEMQSIINKATNKEYLWNGNKEFWGRRSPVLFPFVGALKDKKYIYDGKEYEMGQHGFARDMEFSFKSQTENEIWFNLASNEETIKKYPFEFSLDIGYKLIDNKINVMWKVQNTGNKDMYFSIGAHPAFLVPINDNEKRENCYIKFDTKTNLKNTGLEAGLTNKNNTVNGTINLDNGYLLIDKDLFKYDALIIENNQAHQVSLCDENQNEYLNVTFDAPLFGVWSPYKENCPFVCIEPWYGRADSKEFCGNLQDRQWQNMLKPEEVFEKSYSIEIM